MIHFDLPKSMDGYGLQFHLSPKYVGDLTFPVTIKKPAVQAEMGSLRIAFYVKSFWSILIAVG